ncbi:MAG: hypothetical protein Ct9H300mP14_00530 [Gammaproteobacteria bacterium]|nr:MAG: hypothetical protein Ct9H300mP14_00530 [Gammaproteobacteria bacterium]
MLTFFMPRRALFAGEFDLSYGEMLGLSSVGPFPVWVGRYPQAGLVTGGVRWECL